MSSDTDELIRRFLPGDTLLRLPARHAKRLLVLERVAGRFEPGVRYPEKQVDETLRALTDGGEADHVSVRRYLVDAGLLAREDGVYWRSGGWVAGT